MSDEFISVFEAFLPTQQASRAEDAQTRTCAAPSEFVTGTNSDGASSTAGWTQSNDHRCASKGKPEISLEKDGERITHIRIRCTCGQVTEIECEY